MEYFESFDVKQIENIELFARQVVEGFIIGLHKSPFHGFSVEFAEHRLYNPGESTKNIDWKVFGRTDKMFTKKYEEETNLRCQLIIDTSSSMYFPQDADTLNKVEFSCLAAASLMNLLKRQRDAFGVSLFHEQLQVHTPAKTSLKHYRLMLNYMEQLLKANKSNKTSHIATTLHEVADKVHRRSLMIIFSDLLDSNQSLDDIFMGLQHMKYNKHEVILFHTLHHPYEVALEFENRPYQFIDLENASNHEKIQPKQIQKQYQEKVQAWREKIKLKCLQYKIDLIETDTTQGFATVLQNYLVKRNKMGRT